MQLPAHCASLLTDNKIKCMYVCMYVCMDNCIRRAPPESGHLDFAPKRRQLSKTDTDIWSLKGGQFPKTDT